MDQYNKAKYIGCVHYGWEHTELEYEYRGKTYFVTKNNNGYFDKSLKQQHEEAQKDIDARIEENNKEPAKWKYEGSAQEAFDLFWDYVENAE